MKSSTPEKLGLYFADNGIMVDWGDKREIYPAEPEYLGNVLSKLAGYFEGYYSAGFTRETIEIKIKTREAWADNQGI